MPNSRDSYTTSNYTPTSASQTRDSNRTIKVSANSYARQQEDLYNLLTDPNSTYYKTIRDNYRTGLLDLYEIANKDKAKNFASQGGNVQSSNALVNQWANESASSANEQAKQFSTNLYSSGVGTAANVGQGLLNYSLSSWQAQKQYELAKEQLDNSSSNVWGGLLGTILGSFGGPLLGTLGAKTAKSIWG